jgi:phage baseplate assembly protein W
MLRENITGIAFPLRRKGSYIALSTDNDEMAQENQRIKERIRCLLLTRPGEQVMQRSFGCNLYSFLYEPLGESLSHLISFQVDQAFQRWIPEVKMKYCRVQTKQDQGFLEIHVSYVILKKQQMDQIQLEINRG